MKKELAETKAALAEFRAISEATAKAAAAAAAAERETAERTAVAAAENPQPTQQNPQVTKQDIQAMMAQLQTMMQVLEQQNQQNPEDNQEEGVDAIMATPPRPTNRRQCNDEEPDTTEDATDDRLAKHQNTNATPERKSISKNGHPAGKDGRMKND